MIGIFHTVPEHKSTSINILVNFMIDKPRPLAIVAKMQTKSILSSNCNVFCKVDFDDSKKI